MLALWRLSMHFLLETWHFRATVSMKCLTMEFICQSVHGSCGKKATAAVRLLSFSGVLSGVHCLAQCSGCELWTDRCSLLSALYSWHSGSMGHFNTSTLYPHGTTLSRTTPESCPVSPTASLAQSGYLWDILKTSTAILNHQAKKINKERNKYSLFQLFVLLTETGLSTLQ